MSSSTSPEKSAKHNVAVGVRIRPLNEKEIGRQEEIVWQKSDHEENCILDLSNEEPKQYFDYLFGPEGSTADVYDQMAANIVRDVLNGYNGTIFAYGQTASGKTHTLMGCDEEPGIIILSIRDVFAMIKRSEDSEFLIRVSYIEIYNEEIRDLLAEGSNNKLVIVEDKSKGISINGLNEVVVSTIDETLELLKNGESFRHVGETNMNLRSSRSHTIFKIAIETRKFISTNSSLNNATAKAVKFATLNLVDLAGSERISQTGVTGARLKEGQMINLSLLTLGKVISQLSKGFKGYISYRDSKLTRLLSSSLGGNARTAMITAISPAKSNQHETKSTLQFATRTKSVVNKVVVNEVEDANSLLIQYKLEIDELKAKLDRSEDENVAEIQQEHMIQQLAFEEKAREEEARTKKAEGQIEKLQELLLSGIKIRKNDKAATKFDQDIQDVCSGRRRLDSVALEHTQIANQLNSSRKSRKLSVFGTSARQQIDSIRKRAMESKNSESDEDLNESDSSSTYSDKFTNESSDKCEISERHPSYRKKEMKSQNTEVEMMLSEDILQLKLIRIDEKVKFAEKFNYLGAEIGALKLKITELESSKRESDEIITKLKYSKKAAEKDLEFQKLKQAKDNSDAKNHEKTINTLNVDLKELKKVNNTLEIEYNSLQKESNEEKHILEEKICCADDKNKTITLEMRKLENIVKECELKYHSVDIKYQSLLEERDDLLDSIGSLTNRNQSMIKVIEELKVKYEESQEKIVAISRENSSLITKIEELKHILIESENRNGMLTNDFQSENLQLQYSINLLSWYMQELQS